MAIRLSGSARVALSSGILLALLIGAVLLGVSLASASQDAPQGQRKSTAAQHEQRAPDAAPVAAKKQVAADVPQQQTAEQAQRVRVEEELTRATAQWTEVTGAATVVLAVFTLVLAIVSIWQGRQIKREFVMAHRPQLAVRHMQVRVGMRDGIEVGVISGEIVNRGGTRAHVASIEKNAMLVENGPLPADLTYGPLIRHQQTLAAGTRIPFEIVGTSAMTPAQLGVPGPTNLMVLMRVHYTDDNGDPHDLSVGPYFNPRTGSFYTPAYGDGHDNPYNYSD